MKPEYILYARNLIHKYRARKAEPRDEEPLGIGAIVELESVYQFKKKSKGWNRLGQ